jgi:hypothetical protein
MFFAMDSESLLNRAEALYLVLYTTLYKEEGTGVPSLQYIVLYKLYRGFGVYSMNKRTGVGGNYCI